MDLGNIYPNKAFCDNFHMPKRVQIFSFGENILSSCNEHQKKRRLCKKMRSSPGDIALQIKYSDCVNEWKRLLHQRQTAVEEKIINANNIGAFYVLPTALILVLLLTMLVIHLLLVTVKLMFFNTYFSSVGSVDDGVSSVCQNIELRSVLHSRTIDVHDVLWCINRLNGNSSCGPDGISPVFFKELKHSLSWPLAFIFNQLMPVYGAVPSDYKPTLSRCTKKVSLVRSRTTVQFHSHVSRAS